MLVLLVPTASATLETLEGVLEGMLVLVLVPSHRGLRWIEEINRIVGREEG